jgi:chromate reductase, NAD(P)H dehydrogenase (quinone)
MKILAIPGSLRDGSYNRLLIHAAEELAPAGVEIETFDIDDIPLYNQDEDSPSEPEPVARFRAAIRDADALLLSTPEYNYSVPGVLKNAIDWASRPYGNAPLTGKPVAIMGASTGMSGTMRAQLAWRPVFLFTDSPMVGKPEVYVAQAGQKFDREGRLVDETARTLIRQLLENLVKLAEDANGQRAGSDLASAQVTTASRH